MASKLHVKNDKKIKYWQTPQHKAKKRIYDKNRYIIKQAKKLKEEAQKHKNIYGNRDNLPLSKYTAEELNRIRAKAQKGDAEAQKQLKGIAKEIKGGKFGEKIAKSIGQELKQNYYGNYKTLSGAVKKDYTNFNKLFNVLTPKQQLEFLNSPKYYGARRYSKPVAQSSAFAKQVKEDGASYLVQNLVKYYNDNGLPIPQNIDIPTY